MKAVIAKTPGDVDVLKLYCVNEPSPLENEIKIRVHAFGLNKAESYYRKGRHGKFSGQWALGIEAAGEVVEDPMGDLAQGQKVITAMGGMMFSRHGSYAEYICVKRSNVLAIHSNIDFVPLATLPEAYLTVWGALDYSLRVQPGETLLVRGGTSSIGMAAITYAKARNLNVIATTRRPDRVEKLKALGAEQVVIDDGEIHEKVKAICPKGADKAIELVGAGTVLDSMNSLRHWGELCFVGFLGGPPIIEKLHLMNDLPNTVKLSFFGSGLLGSDALPITEAPLNWIADKLSSGDIPSLHAKTFNISEIQEAHRFLESNTALGKIIVTF